MVLFYYYRDAYQSNSDDFPIGIKWTYEQSTGTTGLWKHIKNVHLDLYKPLCEDHKIQPSESVVGKPTVTPDEALTVPTAQEPFNKDTLLRYIQNFVIADDQVSSY